MVIVQVRYLLIQPERQGVNGYDGRNVRYNVSERTDDLDSPVIPQGRVLLGQT